MKVCNKCYIEKPLSEFYKNNRCAGGLLHSCKQCERARRRKYCKDNPEKIRAYTTKYYKQNKKKLIIKRREYAKTPARGARWNAIQSIHRKKEKGLIIKPVQCIVCLKEKFTIAFLHDDSKRDNIIWMCKSCLYHYRHGKTRYSRMVKRKVDSWK